MDPQESALYHAAIQTYGPLKLARRSTPRFPEDFVSRLEAFVPPCQTVAMWGPVVALQHLAGTLAQIPNNLQRTAPRAGPIRDAWSEVFDRMIANHRFDDVRRWLQFLSSPVNRGLSGPAKTLTLSSVTHFLSAVLKLQGYSICYWFNKAGALGFIGNIWCLEAERSTPLPGASTAEVLHFALLSWAHDMYDTTGAEPSKARYAERLMEETKKSAHELMYLALAHLIRDTEHRARGRVVVHLLVLLLLSRHDPAQQSLQALSAMHIVTRALVRVVRPRLAVRNEFSDDAVTSGCSYLSRSINTGDGASCLVRALEAGFLPSLLAGLRPMHSEFFPLLHSHLPPYLIHLSVVRAAAKALKKIRKLGIEQRLARGGPVFEAWSIFKKVLEERIEVAGKTVHLVCANKQVRGLSWTDSVHLISYLPVQSNRFYR